MYFFLYASSIYITKTDRHDTVTDTGKLPASGFHLFFAAAWLEARERKRRGAGDSFKACRSESTQAKPEAWHFFFKLWNWKHMYVP